MLQFTIVKLAVEGKDTCSIRGTVECTTTCAGSVCVIFIGGRVCCNIDEPGFKLIGSPAVNIYAAGEPAIWKMRR